MAIVPNVTVSAQFPFPATVKGSGPILIGKVNGIWTVAFTIAQLAALAPGFDPSTNFLLVWNAGTGTFQQVSIQSAISAVSNQYRIITAAGDVAVLGTDVVILMNKAVGATTNINLPTSASRNGVPLTVKDYKGDANANPITFVPSGAETIDGFSGAAAAANGEALIDTNYGKKTLYPLTAGGWYV